MKKFLIILLVFIAIIVGALIAIPQLFKDEIRRAIDTEISKNVNAKVYFDTDKIGITIFKDFPDITLTLQDCGIVGVGVFQEDTLAAIDAFDLTVDVGSLIFSDQIQLKSINMVNPRIIVLVREDGQANYDILVESEEDPDIVENEAASTMSVSIDNWTIINGTLVYYDYSNNFLMAMDEIQHSGSGDFSMDNFDLNTHTTIERMMASYGNVEYLKDKRLVAEIILNIDLPNQKYTFLENSISINDFNFGFEGFLEMLSDHYNMDIHFTGEDNSVKSIFSLIPGVYTENFKDIKAEGLLDFNGSVKGIYDEVRNINPSFGIQLSSSNGYIQYPDLPESVSNIRFDLQIDNLSGIYEETVINLKQLHMDLGPNPIDASMKINNLKNYKAEGIIKANVDLDNILKFYPLEDTQLSGNVNANLSVNGVYDTVRHTIPVTGNVNIHNLDYESKDLKQGFKIALAELTLSTARIDVKDFQGTIGNSDLVLKGYLTNYIEYLFEENVQLNGKFDFTSSLVDLNEWMTAEGDSENGVADTTSVEIIKVPENLDFILDSRIGKILYDNLELTDFKGRLTIRDGALLFNDVGFNCLDGLFAMNGSYNTRLEDHPKYDFDLSIKDLSIPKSYKHFITIQKLAPIAEIMEGSFSSEFELNGELNQDFTPDLTTLSGKGLLNIVYAAIQGSNSKVISGITKVSNLKGESTNVGLANVILNSQIENGRVFTQPFNVKFGKNNALIAGSSGLDGSLDYNVKMDVPPEVINTAGSLLTSIAGKDINMNSKDIKINLKVNGNYNDPKISVLGIESGESKQAAQEALKAKVEEEKEKVVVEAEKILEDQQEKAPDEVKKILEDQEENIEKAKNKLRQFLKKDGSG